MSEARETTKQLHREWSEKQVERKIREETQMYGGVAYKFNSEGRASVPDRLIMMPGIPIFFVEVKRWGAVPTQKQFMEGFRILSAAHHLYYVDNLPDYQVILNNVIRNHFPRPSEVSPPGLAYLRFWETCRDKGLVV